MRILLDESLPRPLSQLLTGHDVSTVAREGWTSLDNGALLRQAATTFDVVLTAERTSSFSRTWRRYHSPSLSSWPRATGSKRLNPSCLKSSMLSKT